MTEKWSPWIEHDGRGCPAELIGQTVYLRQMEEVGDLIYEGERYISVIQAMCPTWEWRKYVGKGLISEMELNGELLSPRYTTHYRVRLLEVEEEAPRLAEMLA